MKIRPFNQKKLKVKRKLISFLFLMLFLAGCSAKTNGEGTNFGNEQTLDVDKPNETNLTMNTTFTQGVVKISVRKGEKCNFPILDFTYKDNHISIENGVIFGINSGETSFEKGSIRYLIIVEENDLYEFYCFIKNNYVERTYQFKVYSGNNYYWYQGMMKFNFTTEDAKEIIDILPYSKARSGIKRTVKWIVIHDTGNITKGSNAINHSAYLKSIMYSQSISWHYVIDDTSIVQNIPLDEVAYHAGDGLKEIGEGAYLGGGNLNGIGIEMAQDEGNNLLQTYQNTAKKTALLLVQYGLSVSQVKRHVDFSEKNCPQTINNNGLWEDFIKMVEVEYALLTIYSNYSISTTNGGFILKNLKTGNVMEENFVK